MQNQSINSIFCTVLLLLVGISLISAEELTPEVSQQLDAINASMEQLTLANNYDELIKYFTKDVITMPNFKPTLYGRDALVKEYETNQKMGLRYHSFTGTSQKRWRCGNEIFEQGTFGMAISTNQSPLPMAFYGSYFQIWREEPQNVFKISYTIWNLDFDPFAGR